MTSRLLGALALSTAVLGFCTAAHSQSSDACAPFTIMAGGGRSVEYLDFGNDGPGPGDLRIGRRTLVDEAGNGKGYYRWVIVQLDTPPGADEPAESFGTFVMNLPDGQIHYQLFTGVVGTPDNTAQPSVGDSIGVIVGGTGAYRFARGVIDREFEGTDVTYTVDIRCD